MDLMSHHEQNEREVDFADWARSGRLPLGSYSAPGSPKMCELRARNGALHDNDLNASNPEWEISLFIRY